MSSSLLSESGLHLPYYATTIFNSLTFRRIERWMLSAPTIDILQLLKVIKVLNLFQREETGSGSDFSITLRPKGADSDDVDLDARTEHSSFLRRPNTAASSTHLSVLRETTYAANFQKWNHSQLRTPPIIDRMDNLAKYTRSQVFEKADNEWSNLFYRTSYQSNICKNPETYSSQASTKSYLRPEDKLVSDIDIIDLYCKKVIQPDFLPVVKRWLSIAIEPEKTIFLEVIRRIMPQEVGTTTYCSAIDETSAGLGAEKWKNLNDTKSFSRKAFCTNDFLTEEMVDPSQGHGHDDAEITKRILRTQSSQSSLGMRPRVSHSLYAMSFPKPNEKYFHQRQDHELSERIGHYRSNIPISQGAKGKDLSLFNTTYKSEYHKADSEKKQQSKQRGFQKKNNPWTQPTSPFGFYSQSAKEQHRMDMLKDQNPNSITTNEVDLLWETTKNDFSPTL